MTRRTILLGEFWRYHELAYSLSDSLLKMHTHFLGDADKFHFTEDDISEAFTVWLDFLSYLQDQSHEEFPDSLCAPVLKAVPITEYENLKIDPLTEEAISVLGEILSAIDSHCARLMKDLGWTW